METHTHSAHDRDGSGRTPGAITQSSSKNSGSVEGWEGFGGIGKLGGGMIRMRLQLGAVLRTVVGSGAGAQGQEDVYRRKATREHRGRS